MFLPTAPRLIASASRTPTQRRSSQPTLNTECCTHYYLAARRRAPHAAYIWQRDAACRISEAMLRGFGTATNATLKELLASDTDQAEDPGADGDDVDAFVRAASPLFGASDEPWTHESIKPPATPPRSPEGDGTDTDPLPTDAAELSRARRDGDGGAAAYVGCVASKPAVSPHELHGRN